MAKGRKKKEESAVISDAPIEEAVEAEIASAVEPEESLGKDDLDDLDPISPVVDTPAATPVLPEMVYVDRMEFFKLMRACVTMKTSHYVGHAALVSFGKILGHKSWNETKAYWEEVKKELAAG